MALRLGFASDEFSYAIDLGLPVPSAKTMFERDPEIKVESVWSGPVLRPATLLTERHGASVRIRGADGEWAHHERSLRPYDSMLSELADPSTAAVGTRTPVLGAEGADLIEPLAKLIAGAAKNSQVIVVSHASRLIAALDGLGASRIELEKREGETTVVGQGLLDEPLWKWPTR